MSTGSSLKEFQPSPAQHFAFIDKFSTFLQGSPLQQSLLAELLSHRQDFIFQNKAPDQQCFSQQSLRGRKIEYVNLLNNNEMLFPPQASPSGHQLPQTQILLLIVTLQEKKGLERGQSV